MKKASELNVNHPIAVAVLPLKKDAIERAEKDEREFIKKTLAGLNVKGWDINAFVPAPDSLNSSRESYRIAMRARSFVESITKRSECLENEEYSRLGFRAKCTAPLFVELANDKVERHIEITREMAAAQYDAFVGKMIKKIGDVTEATISGNHVWGYSVLTVITKAGEKQLWKTQQIVNRSVYNLLFNQWPSRQMKGTAA